jgi:hypothetical protein
MTSVGTPLESHNVRRDFRKVTKAAGLGERWVPKELPPVLAGHRTVIATR